MIVLRTFEKYPDHCVPMPIQPTTFGRFAGGWGLQLLTVQYRPRVQALRGHRQRFADSGITPSSSPSLAEAVRYFYQDGPQYILSVLQHPWQSRAHPLQWMPAACARLHSLARMQSIFAGVSETGLRPAIRDPDEEGSSHAIGQHSDLSA